MLFSNSDSSSHLENRPCKYRRELLSTQRRQNYPERVNLMTNLIFDDDTRLMVSIFQKVFHLRYVERDQVKYVKRYADAIRSTGQLFEYLGLARPDKQSPLGWRATLVLLDIVNKHARGKSKRGTKP